MAWSYTSQGLPTNHTPPSLLCQGAPVAGYNARRFPLPTSPAMACQSPIIVALDFPSREAALALAARLDPAQCRVKVGKELFTRCGPAVVEDLQAKGFEVFLDLKFHDIPNTTAMAVKAAAELGVWMVNVHCSGGLRMMAACRETLDKANGDRKSTRLNSSHVRSSYAVFCLKKKKI